MPIKSCAKCSLKVYVDDTAKVSEPFHCTRCAETLKGTRRVVKTGPSPATARNPAPAKGVPPSAPVTPPSDTAVADETASVAAPGLVRLICPMCHAAFQAKLPARTSRGPCPKCKKDLTIAPDGHIRYVGVTERVAPAGAASAPPPSSPSADETSIDDPAPESAARSSGPDPDILPDLSSAARQETVRRIPAGDTVDTDIRAASAAEAELDAIYREDGGAPKGDPRKASLTERLAAKKAGRPGSAARERGAALAVATTGSGKIFLGLLLLALPVGAAAGLFAKRNDEKIGAALERIGDRARKAAAEFHENMGWDRKPKASPSVAPAEPEPPPVPVEPQKPPEAGSGDAKSDPQARVAMMQAIQDRILACRRMQFRLKEMQRATRPAAEIQQKSTEIQQMLAEIERMKDTYRKAFGEEFVEER